MKLFSYVTFLILISFPGMISESASDLPVSMIRESFSVCSLVNCGLGTCVPASNLLGFECDCFPGWNKPPLLPTCIIPNCTTDSGCGGAPATPPLVLPPVAPPNLNLSDPCSLTWCGDGICIPNGTSYNCSCSPGSDNYQNLTALPCFHECSFQGDCPGAFVPPIVAGPPTDVCANVFCGEGKCKPSNSLIGYDCECDPGWTNLVFPPCTIPNCTINVECGSKPLLLPPPTLPQFDILDPCSMAWCGDGECVVDGIFPKCNCNAGSDNLLNLTAFPCFNKCSLEGDCDSILTVPPSPAPSDAAPLSLTGISIVGVVLMAALVTSIFSITSV